MGPILATGYVMTGTEIRTVAVDFDKANNLNVTGGECHWLLCPAR